MRLAVYTFVQHARETLNQIPQSFFGEGLDSAGSRWTRGASVVLTRVDSVVFKLHTFGKELLHSIFKLQVRHSPASIIHWHLYGGRLNSTFDRRVVWPDFVKVKLKLCSSNSSFIIILLSTRIHLVWRLGVCNRSIPINMFICSLCLYPTFESMSFVAVANC